MPFLNYLDLNRSVRDCPKASKVFTLRSFVRRDLNHAVHYENLFCVCATFFSLKE